MRTIPFLLITIFFLEQIVAIRTFTTELNTTSSQKPLSKKILEEQIVEEPSSTKALENEVILSKKNEKEIESPFESVTEDALNKLLNEVAENTDSLTDVLESIVNKIGGEKELKALNNELSPHISKEEDSSSSEFKASRFIYIEDTENIEDCVEEFQSIGLRTLGTKERISGFKTLISDLCLPRLNTWPVDLRMIACTHLMFDMASHQQSTSISIQQIDALCTNLDQIHQFMQYLSFYAIKHAQDGGFFAFCVDLLSYDFPLAVFSLSENDVEKFCDVSELYVEQSLNEYSQYSPLHLLSKIYEAYEGLVQDDWSLLLEQSCMEEIESEKEAFIEICMQTVSDTTDYFLSDDAFNLMLCELAQQKINEKRGILCGDLGDYLASKYLDNMQNSLLSSISY